MARESGRSYLFGMGALSIIVSATSCCAACGGSTAQEGSIESGEQAFAFGTAP